MKNFLQAQKLGSQQCFLEKLRKGGKKAIDEELEQDDESQAAKATKLANLDNFQKSKLLRDSIESSAILRQMPKEAKLILSKT